MKLFFTTLLLVSLLLSTSFLHATMADNSSFCESKCEYRCSKAGRWKLCKKDCLICCGTCNCVPPGTYGNKEECPCYANLLNSEGESKCP